MPIYFPPFDVDDILTDKDGNSLSDKDGNIIIK